MEQNFRSELQDELDRVDVDSLKLDAVIQLRAWQKRMYSLVDRTYKARLHEIDSMANNWTNEIQEKQDEIGKAKINDRNTYLQLKHDIAALQSSIQIVQSIPDNFQQRIDRTVHISRQEETLDDESVLVDIDTDDEQADEEVDSVEERHEQAPVAHEEGRVSKILHSEPVQRSIAIGVAKAITQMGVVAATSTTTIAATTMAKTAIIATVCGVGTVAYGVGRIAVGTTKQVWSWAVSSED